jgi:hypothetical protein
MKTNEKVEAIKYLKEIVVKYQKYEFAAWLRDKERNILDELTGTYSYLPDGPISYAQYLYLTELISEFDDETLPRHLDYTSLMKEYLYKICLPVIRAEKLDKLLGDES